MIGRGFIAGISIRPILPLRRSVGFWLNARGDHGGLAPMPLEELTRRVAVTLGALLVYRLGVHIPLPGIDPSVWAAIFHAGAGKAAGPFALFAGGGGHRFGICALGIVPYISAAVIMQLATIVSRRVRALKNRGERGRRIINRRTLYLTALLAALQAYGIAGALAGMPNVVANPGWPFVISTVATLTGGTLFLAWLCEQITVRGIGNGIALILLTGIVAELPRATAGALELGRQGVLSNNFLIALTAIIVAATGFVVLMERARRRLTIQYPGRQVGGRTIAGRSSYLPVKLNAAGVIPVVLASWLMVVLTGVATMAAGQEPGWPATIAAQLQHGRPLSMILNAVFIVLCAYFYTAFVLDPDETADSLKRHGGSIAAIEPGAATAEHVDHVVSRTTANGGRLSGAGVPDTGHPDLLCRGAVLFRRPVAADRGVRDPRPRFAGSRRARANLIRQRSTIRLPLFGLRSYACRERATAGAAHASLSTAQRGARCGGVRTGERGSRVRRSDRYLAGQGRRQPAHPRLWRRLVRQHRKPQASPRSGNRPAVDRQE